MTSTAELISSGQLSVAQIEREIRGRMKLGDKRYAHRFVDTVVDAWCKAMREPDVEVRVSFDSVTELNEAIEMVSKMIVDFKAVALVDWEKSTSEEGDDGKDCIEFLNGSALRFIGPDGAFYLQKK